MGYSPWGHKGLDTTERLSTQRDRPLHAHSGKLQWQISLQFHFPLLLGGFPGGTEQWSHSPIPLLHTADGGGLPETRISNHSAVLSSSLY